MGKTITLSLFKSDIPEVKDGYIFEKEDLSEKRRDEYKDNYLEFLEVTTHNKVLNCCYRQARKRKDTNWLNWEIVNVCNGIGTATFRVPENLTIILYMQDNVQSAIAAIQKLNVRHIILMYPLADGGYKECAIK